MIQTVGKQLLPSGESCQAMPTDSTTFLIAGVMLHDAFFFTLPIFFARGVPLVVQLLAAPKPEIELDAPVLVVQVQRHQGITSLFHLADQLADFFCLEQQFACTGRVWMNMR